MGDASILPPAPVAATGFDREYVRAYLEELLIDKIGNPHTDPEVSKFLEWLAAPVATEDHIPTMPAEDAAMLWLASVRDDFRKMADEANSTLQRRLVEMASAPVQPAPVAGPVAWHDIASAPKDGTAIMLRNEGGAWIGKWQSIAASGYTFDQPWRSLMLNHYHIPVSHRYLPPTHWMPLPPAPDASPSPAPVAAPVVTDAPQLPEGFRLLPVEATDSMMDAEWNVSMSEAHSNGGVSAAAWRAMVEAAPQVTYGDGHSGVGWYMHDTDYPEEGAVFLSRAILAAQSGAGTRGEQT